MANTYIDKGQLEAVEMWFRRMQRVSWESDRMNTSLNLSDKQTTHETDDCHVDYTRKIQLCSTDQPTNWPCYIWDVLLYYSLICLYWVLYSLVDFSFFFFKKKKLPFVQPDTFGLAYKCGARSVIHNLIFLFFVDIGRNLWIVSCAPWKWQVAARWRDLTSSVVVF